MHRLCFSNLTNVVASPYRYSEPTIAAGGYRMRAIWTGAISFGHINIPVKLYSGSESRDGLDLHMLHEKDKSPIRYAKFCKAENKEVPYDEIVKGFEYAKGEF